MVQAVQPDVSDGAPVEREVVVCHPQRLWRASDDDRNQHDAQDDGVVVVGSGAFDFKYESYGFAQVYDKPCHDEQHKQTGPVVHVHVVLDRNHAVRPQHGRASLKVAHCDVEGAHGRGLGTPGLVQPKAIERRRSVCHQSERLVGAGKEGVVVVGAQRAEGSRAGVRRFAEAHVGVEEEESLLRDSDSGRDGEVIERLVVEAQLVCDEHRRAKWAGLNVGICKLCCFWSPFFPSMAIAVFKPIGILHPK